MNSGPLTCGTLSQRPCTIHLPNAEETFSLRGGNLSPLLQLLVAAGLGLLVGLEREWSKQPLAGIRTFPIITVFGTISALLALQAGGWIIAASALAVTTMLAVGNYNRSREGHPDSGLTTEMATLVMFGVGAMIVYGLTLPALVTTGGVAVLLHWKKPLHELVSRIGEADFRAITRLVLVALVILPVLPNRTYGPYDVLNPFQIWLMVVLIVGISMGAYVIQRLMGTTRSALVVGGLGGLISSTAATIAYARETRPHPARSALTTFIILVASSVVFIRVILELIIVAPGGWSRTVPPLVVMMGFMMLLATVSFFVGKSEIREPQRVEAPGDLKAPVTFGLLYALVLFLVAAAQRHFGSGGMFVVAGFSGLTDMDALTLSTAQLVRTERMNPDTAWRLILVASMANLVFKGAAVAMMGNAKLALRVGLFYLAAIVGGFGILWLW